MRQRLTGKPAGAALKKGSVPRPRGVWGERVRAALRSSGALECLAAFAVHALVFLLPVYALRAWMAASGMDPPCPPNYVELGQGPVDWRPLNPLVFYDAANYLAVAAGGYRDTFQAAWFPLYPLLVRLFGGTAASAVFVSGAAFFAALLAARRLGGRASVWALALWPLGMLSVSAYSESLSLALAGWALVCLEGGRRPAAALLLGLACLCRPTGWAVLAGAGLRLLAKGGWRAAVVTCAPAALLGALYPLYLWGRFGDPLAFTLVNFELQKRVFSLPWGGLAGDLRGVLLPAGNPFWETWSPVAAVNLAGLFYMLAAVLAEPLLSLPYAALVLCTGVADGHLPHFHGLLRYAAGFFPWCLAVRSGPAGRVFTALGAGLGVLVSLRLFFKEFVV